MHNFEMVDVKDIRQLILDLRVLHAAQFNKNFPLTGPSAMPMEKVEEIALEALIGITKNQFDKARARLKTSGSKFMPSFSEFREWCIGESWMSADEAWSRACKFTKDKNTPITELTKYALDEVMYLMADGLVKEARAQFITTYITMIAKAQYFGRVQQMYQSPKQLEQKKKEHVAVSNDEAQKHLNALMKTLNINNRKVPQPQKLEPTAKFEPVIKEPWPDPFDQPGDYLENCARDGVNVPTTVKKHIGGTA